MHVLDLKGVIAIAGGSLIWKIVTTVSSLGNTQEIRLNKINEQMKEFQKGSTSHRMPSLRLSNLRCDGWAMLSGPVIKAANSRALLPFFNHLAQKYFAAHGDYSSSIRKVFLALTEIERIFYTSDMFLEDKTKTELEDAFLRLGRHWQNLRHLSGVRNENAWQIRPKVHYAQHFVEQADLINPRVVQNYQEESLIGVVTKVWQACARGPYEKTIQKKALNRMWVGLELRITA